MLQFAGKMFLFCAVSFMLKAAPDTFRFDFEHGEGKKLPPKTRHVIGRDEGGTLQVIPAEGIEPYKKALHAEVDGQKPDARLLILQKIPAQNGQVLQFEGRVKGKGTAMFGIYGYRKGGIMAAPDKFQIARRHLLLKAREAMGIGEQVLEVPEETIRTIISEYTMEGGVRGLKKRMDTLCREAAVRVVKGEDPLPLIVTPENVREFIDAKPIRHDHILEKKNPGIVTGLAWTAAGGEILFIETLLSGGSGKVQITGQLGDVMKESVQIALSLVKSLFPEEAKKLENSDLHVHVPAGAVPKDGPSAGITLTTALASLITGREVSPDIAMTGEISLRGVVMPIGGLPEKLMAAVRAGISRVLIPAENMDDLDEVPAEVKDQLEIIPVHDIQEVLKITEIC